MREWCGAVLAVGQYDGLAMAQFLQCHDNRAHPTQPTNDGYCLLKTTVVWYCMRGYETSKNSDKSEVWYPPL